MSSYPTNIMQIKELLERDANATVDLQETSKSWIFLGHDRVFKLKKPVRDDLQDLTTMRARFDNCMTEIDLNRRLAAETYLGIVRLVRQPNGALTIGGTEETIDWLIEMRRLPADQMLDVLALDDTRTKADLRPSIAILADQLGRFYESCPVSNLDATELATIILDQQERNLSTLRHPMFKDYHPRFEKACDAFRTAFFEHFDLFEARVKSGWIRECHGDLRPEHICLTDPPIIFDCLEFNRNLRMVDPFSEVAFLGMEAELLGKTWIKTALSEGLSRALCHCPEPQLLALYETLHAVMRTRICLAHLLVPAPRTPQKWLPLGLRYMSLAENRLCGPLGLEP